MSHDAKTDPDKFGPEDEKLFDALVSRVVGYRMEVPAVLFLESVRPLNFIGSQALVFFEPMVKTLFNWEQYDRFTHLMSDRDNLDKLIRMIEDQADERDDTAKGRDSTPPDNPDTQGRSR